jgi:hypothetical protein
MEKAELGRAELSMLALPLSEPAYYALRTFKIKVLIIVQHE